MAILLRCSILLVNVGGPLHTGLELHVRGHFLGDIMNKILIASTAALVVLGSSAYANSNSPQNFLCNGNCQGNGNKTGWADDEGTKINEKLPKGLIVSGDNGRVDNGKGNGGENPDGNTPTWQGEEADWDEDPNDTD